MFSNIGFPEILLILVAVLLLFGAKRIPEIGASFGKGIREFQRSLREVKDAVQELPPEEPRGASRQLDAPPQSPAGPTPTSGEPKRLSQ
jgi:sec-independent protein translocase protein TatA